MQSFREIASGLISHIKTKMPGIDVRYGQYGEIPTVTPALLIYAEPYGEGNDSTGVRKIRFMKFTIFALAGGTENLEEAVFESFEILESVEDVIADFEREYNLSFVINDSPISFDAVYNDIAVSYFEFLSAYRRHQDG